MASVKLKLRAAVERHELLSIELERCGHHRPCRPRSAFAVTATTLKIFEFLKRET